MNFIKAAKAAFDGEKVYYRDFDNKKVFLTTVRAQEGFPFHIFKLSGTKLDQYPLDLYSVQVDNWQIEAKKPKIIVERKVNFADAAKAARLGKTVYLESPYEDKLYLHFVKRNFDKTHPGYLTTCYLKNGFLGVDDIDAQSLWIVAE